LIRSSHIVYWSAETLHHKLAAETKSKTTIAFCMLLCVRKFDLCKASCFPEVFSYLPYMRSIIIEFYSYFLHPQTAAIAIKRCVQPMYILLALLFTKGFVVCLNVFPCPMDQKITAQHFRIFRRSHLITPTPNCIEINAYPVILNEVKDLRVPLTRFFAALRMTSRIVG